MKSINNSTRVFGSLDRVGKPRTVCRHECDMLRTGLRLGTGANPCDATATMSYRRRAEWGWSGLVDNVRNLLDSGHRRDNDVQGRSLAAGHSRSEDNRDSARVQGKQTKGACVAKRRYLRSEIFSTSPLWGFVYLRRKDLTTLPDAIHIRECGGSTTHFRTQFGDAAYPSTLDQGLSLGLSRRLFGWSIERSVGK